MFETIIESVHVLVSRSFDSNMTYLDCGERQILVDTGTGMYASNLERELENVGTSSEKITDIVLTHSHIDHIGGVVPFLERNTPKLHLHKSEADRINSGDMTLTLANTFGADLPSMVIDGILNDGDILDIGDLKIKIHSTPGHSSGSICLEILDTGILITGDTLFAGGSFGRVDFPTGSPKLLVDSLKKISEMDIEVAIPGHMGIIRHNATRSALQSYEVAKNYFKV